MTSHKTFKVAAGMHIFLYMYMYLNLSIGALWVVSEVTYFGTNHISTTLLVHVCVQSQISASQLYMSHIRLPHT